MGSAVSMYRFSRKLTYAYNIIMAQITLHLDNNIIEM